jgi:hypothetical protein
MWKTVRKTLKGPPSWATACNTQYPATNSQVHWEWWRHLWKFVMRCDRRRRARVFVHCRSSVTHGDSPFVLQCMWCLVWCYLLQIPPESPCIWNCPVTLLAPRFWTRPPKFRVLLSSHRRIANTPQQQPASPNKQRPQHLSRTQWGLICYPSC